MYGSSSPGLSSGFGGVGGTQYARPRLNAQTGAPRTSPPAGQQSPSSPQPYNDTTGNGMAFGLPPANPNTSPPLAPSGGMTMPPLTAPTATQNNPWNNTGGPPGPPQQIGGTAPGLPNPWDNSGGPPGPPQQIGGMTPGVPTPWDNSGGPPGPPAQSGGGLIDRFGRQIGDPGFGTEPGTNPPPYSGPSGAIGPNPQQQQMTQWWQQQYPSYPGMSW